MKRKIQYLKGGFLSLLSFFLLNCSAFGQSFFYAETTPSAASYGEIHTTQLLPEAAALLKSKELSQQEWSTFFNVKTALSNPATLGTYSVRDNQVVFSPRFLPDPSVNYTVNFSYRELNRILGSSFAEQTHAETVTFSAVNSEQPKVVSISPDLDIFPENILRIYVNFDSPMSFQNPYDFISIKNEKGNELVEPFVIVPEGLWNIDRTRLTLLFHPGRIKRGVGPNMTEGKIFQLGQNYTLEIDSKWKGANGKSLKKSMTKSFSIAKSINESIPYNLWELNAAQNDSSILTIRTIHPLDQVLAKRMLSIRTEDGVILPSNVKFKDGYELSITWANHTSKKLELLIDPRLEDVCGNTPINAFDYKKGERSNFLEPLTRSFRIN